MRIASMAETCNVKVTPRNPHGPMALAANLHACAAIPNFLILEHWRYNSLFDEVQQFGARVANGYLEVSDRPGLGVELNWEWVQKHPFHFLNPYKFPEADGGVVLV